jgi:hypothetical protein
MVNKLERLAASTGETEGKDRRRRVQRAEPSLDFAAPAQVCGTKGEFAATQKNGPVLGVPLTLSARTNQFVADIR